MFKKTMATLLMVCTMATAGAITIHQKQPSLFLSEKFQPTESYGRRLSRDFSHSVSGYLSAFSGLSIATGLFLFFNLSLNDEHSGFDWKARAIGSELLIDGAAACAIASLLGYNQLEANLGISLIAASPVFFSLAASEFRTSQNRNGIFFSAASLATFGSGIYLSKDWIKEHPITSTVIGGIFIGITAAIFAGKCF
jgi:hypothetical protein